MVVCATYACIAPLSLVAGLCYFAGAAFVYKHQMLYVYEPIFETGGKWWPKVRRDLPRLDDAHSGPIQAPQHPSLSPTGALRVAPPGNCPPAPRCADT